MLATRAVESLLEAARVAHYAGSRPIHAATVSPTGARKNFSAPL
jgi:hypothetical protein